jgi:hypothetical protein
MTHHSRSQKHHNSACQNLEKDGGEKKVDNFINQNRKQIKYKKLPLKSSKITQIIYKHKQ